MPRKKLIRRFEPRCGVSRIMVETEAKWLAREWAETACSLPFELVLDLVVVEYTPNDEYRDTSTDVFGIGAILFFLATGNDPAAKPSPDALTRSASRH